MIYLTGDTHGSIDIHKLNKRYFDDTNLTKDDYLIICGDFGLVWDNSPEEKYWLDWLNEKNYTTLFVDGNHENHPLLNSYPIETWNGGKVHKIRNSILHLMRGQVFTIDSHTFFTMGGAASVDKDWRTPGKSWWPEEMPSEEEYIEANLNLYNYENEVDYIITHTAPTSIVNQLIPETKPPDRFTDFLENIKKSIKYKHWYFGHFHDDRDIDEQHTLLYYNIIPLEE